MSSIARDVFSLRDSVIDDYRRFATSFSTIHATDEPECVLAIAASHTYWPEPVIQINPSNLQTGHREHLVIASMTRGDD